MGNQIRCQFFSYKKVNFQKLLRLAQTIECLHSQNQTGFPLFFKKILISLKVYSFKLPGYHNANHY